MRTRGISGLLLVITLAILLGGCRWCEGFTIVLPDREIKVIIPETGVKIPDVEFNLFERDRVRGSGDLIIVEREIHDFDKISVKGPGEISLIQGNEESLTVTIEDNLLEYLETKVIAGTLTLGWDPDNAKKLDLRPSHPIQFELVVKDLTTLSIYGSTDVSSEGLSLDRLVIDIYGSGDVSMGNVESERVTIHLYGVGDIKIESLIAKNLMVGILGIGNVKLDGEVEEQQINIPGKGDYRAGELFSEVAYVSIHGSGDATMWVTEYLEGEVIGSGNLKYYGDPKAYFSGVGSGKFEDLGEH